MTLSLKGRWSSTYRITNPRWLAARGATVGVVLSAGSLAYAALWYILSAVPGEGPAPISWPALVAGLFVSAVVLASPASTGIRRYVEGRLPGTRRDARRAFKILETYARDIGDLSTLALAVEHAVTIATTARDVHLLVPAGNGTWFLPVSRRISGGVRPLQLHSSGAIVTWLRFHDAARRREDLLAEPWHLPLSAQEHGELQRHRVRLLVPVKLREELVGVIALSSRVSGEGYTTRDLRTLGHAAGQMAMWVANALVLATSAAQRVRLEQLLHRSVRAQEDERRRLAVELHDSPVQWLTSAAYHVEACLESFRRGDRDNVGRQLMQVRGTLDRALSELRQTAAALHPPELEQVGLVKALARHTAIFERDTGIPTELAASGGVPRLPAPVELAVYRVVQEALSNVRKHAHAGEAEVRMGLHNGAFWAVIRDDGVGFDADDGSLARLGHLGLAGMEERAHALGGTLGIQSSPGEGTQVTLLIPHVHGGDNTGTEVAT